MAMDSRVHEVINVNKVVANTSSSAVIICSQCSVGLIAVRGHLLGSVSRATSVAAPLTLAEDGLVVLADHLVVICAIKTRAGMRNLGMGILPLGSDSTHNKF